MLKIKDIINMDDLNLDNSETLKSKGFGNMSLNKLLKANELTVKSKGLVSLMEGSSNFVDSQNIDPMVLNEILRTIREKNNYVENKLTLLENKLVDIKELTTKNNKEDLLKRVNRNKNSFLLISLILLAFGFFLGSYNSAFDLASPLKKKAIVTKALPQMITTKHLNLRLENSPKSKIISTIGISQIVTILGSKGGWFYVSYHNRLNGSKRTGYLWGDYLGKLK
jgi:hypothetical protein